MFRFLFAVAALFAINASASADWIMTPDGMVWATPQLVAVPQPQTITVSPPTVTITQGGVQMMATAPQMMAAGACATSASACGTSVASSRMTIKSTTTVSTGARRKLFPLFPNRQKLFGSRSGC